MATNSHVIASGIQANHVFDAALEVIREIIYWIVVRICDQKEVNQV